MHGADERLVDADEIRRLEPNLRMVPREAIWRPRDGAVDPVAVTEALIDAARRHGAQVRPGEAVRGLRMQDGAVVGVETSMGTFASRTVVLAARVEVPTLCAAVGVDLPIAASPAVLMRFDASPGLLRRLLHCPWGDFRQTKDGMLLAAAGTANKKKIGVRPMPVDGLPIIGSLPGHPGGYIAVMHSAVTLAPAAGRLVADELIDALDLEELQGVRANRFVTAAETARASWSELACRAPGPRPWRLEPVLEDREERAGVVGDGVGVGEGFDRERAGGDRGDADAVGAGAGDVARGVADDDGPVARPGRVGHPGRGRSAGARPRLRVVGAEAALAGLEVVADAGALRA